MHGKICVDIHERLGNQMFSYAYGRAIQIEQHPDYQLSLAFNLIKRGGGYDRTGWENSLRYLNISPNCITVEKHNLSIWQLTMFGLVYCLQSIYKVAHINKDARVAMQKFLNTNGIYTSYNSYNLQQWNTNKKNIYLRGRFEAYQYFDGIRDTLIKEFTPKEDKIEKNKELYKIIENNESVCISIRRGDFLSNERSNFNVCNTDYFNKAIEAIKSEVKDPVFIVFSDDIEDVKRTFHFNNPVYYEDGDDPVWEKLRMMYSCRHFIISNSTFAWWAQYLSRNKDKIVFAPKKWRLGDEDCSGLYLPYMRVVENVKSD